jgi:uncharacterized protein (TIGR02145 family)
MKRIFITLISSLIICCAYSQDIIYKNDGGEIQSSVIEITSDVIKYKNFNQLDGPVRNISISDVFMVIYKDGTKEVFKGKSEEVKQQINNPNSSGSDEAKEPNPVDLAGSNPENTFKDTRDGKVYKLVKIGNQVWMAENLAFNIKNGSAVYDNNKSLIADIGLLYNYETAKNACPNGWHLPSQNEWEELILFSGGPKQANKNLKPTSGWIKPKEKFTFNTLRGGTTWEITLPKYDGGFGAFPAGYCSDGPFTDLGFSASWWVVSEGKKSKHINMYSSDKAEMEISDYSLILFNAQTFTKDYRSIRCIKD